MTVSMGMMNQMFRDFKVAEDVGKMMELRRFEVEFEVYGTVYWADHERHYLVSKNEDTIYQQIKELELKGCYPLPMQKRIERSLVPAGTEEDIENRVKYHFAQDLRAKFTPDLWEKILSIADGVENDAGREILDSMQEQLEGLFREDQLQMFRGLVLKLYLRRNITKASFERYLEWLKEEEQEMIDNIITKDIFEKTFFGIAYQDQQGNIQYNINANRQIIVDKISKLERLGNFIITPIFHKKYYYNYNYKLADVRKDFQGLLEQLYDADYFKHLKKIEALPISIDCKQYSKIQEEFKFDNDLEIVWKAFGAQWGIISCAK